MALDAAAANNEERKCRSGPSYCCARMEFELQTLARELNGDTQSAQSIDGLHPLKQKKGRFAALKFHQFACLALNIHGELPAGPVLTLGQQGFN